MTKIDNYYYDIKKDINKLYRYAKIFGVEKKIRNMSL